MSDLYESGNEITVMSQPDYADYRSLSKAAVISVILAVCSLLFLLFRELLIVPVIGVLIGGYGLRQIIRRPEELSGRGVAWTGTIACLLILIIGGSLYGYEYATEVPEGYSRMSFTDLKPKNPMVDPIPDLARQLDGKKVFVKGYVHPGVQGMGEIRNFILVPDMKTCCFGGQPKIWDMIEVRLKTPQGVTYNRRVRKLAGVFRLNPNVRKMAGGITSGYYELEVEHVE